MDLLEQFFFHFKTSHFFRLRVICAAFLVSLFYVFSVIMLVRAALSLSEPRWNVEFLGKYMPASTWQELLPAVAICPGYVDDIDSEGPLRFVGDVSDVTCQYVKMYKGEAPKRQYELVPLQVDPVKRRVDHETFRCFEVNNNLLDAPLLAYENITNFIHCTFKAAGYARVMPFSQLDLNKGTTALRSSDPHVESWRSIKSGHMSKLAVAKVEVRHAYNWMFAKPEEHENYFYQIVSAEEEMRFVDSYDDERKTGFTLQFNYLSNKRYQEFYQHDFLTTFGIIGGVGLLLKVAYDLFVHVARIVIKTDDGELTTLEQVEDAMIHRGNTETQPLRSTVVQDRRQGYGTNNQRAAAVGGVRVRSPIIPRETGAGSESAQSHGHAAPSAPSM